MHDERPAQCPPPVFDPNARKSAFTYSLDLRAGIVALLLLAAGLSFAILVTASNRHRRTGSSLESVSSAALRSVGYDADSRALDVEFHSGDIYRYYDVPPSVYAGLMAADSHGRYFHEHIRGQSYRYVKLWPVSVIPGEHSEPIGEAKRPIDRALDAAEVTQKHQDLVNRIERMRREIEAEKPLLEAARAIQRNQEPPAAVRMADLLGEAVIMSNDGEFLGVISTDTLSPRSIMNSFGVHGSEYAEKSIFNDYGRFGGEYSLNSPWNRYSSTPPKVYLRERFVGFLTKNPVMTPRIDPDALVGLLKSSE